MNDAHQGEQDPPPPVRRLGAPLNLRDIVLAALLIVHAIIEEVLRISGAV